MKKSQLILGVVISAAVAGIGMSYALPVSSHGFKSATLATFPSKKAMQYAPNYVIAVDNNLNENINVTLSDAWNSGSWTYGANSIDFPYTNDNTQTANVQITNSDNTVMIYSGTMSNDQCITITSVQNGYHYQITNNCIPLQEALAK